MRDPSDLEVTGVPRQIRRLHEIDGTTASVPVRALTRVRRLLQPAKQLLEDDRLYLFHTKANMKRAIEGGMYMWHQDYASWQYDGIPTPNMLTAVVMLDDATEFSGCLYFVPQSHKLGTLERAPKVGRFGPVPNERLLDIFQTHPQAVALTGEAGTVAFFHSNIVHASGHNLSGNHRRHLYLVYNPVANRPLPVPNPRDDAECSQNYEVLLPQRDEAITGRFVPVWTSEDRDHEFV